VGVASEEDGPGESTAAAARGRGLAGSEDIVEKQT
jgi:hypothetical protein